ncbi:MAG: metallophosphoesterase family protein [Nannocystaceae bacterium]|nr:metallophosphoesterase family protein [Nannocystaceae bacterium]
MRVAALSDLHIGLDGRTDAFGHDATAFASFLDRLLATHDRVVLLGDVFTADHAALWGPSHARAHLQRILVRVPWLADRLAGPRVHYVHGNHDLVARDVLGAAERIVLARGAIRVLFIHGHQFDPIARRALRLAQAGTWGTGRLRAARAPVVAQWLEDRDVAIKDARFRGAMGPYARAAERLCREENLSAVVMGHTHAARVDAVEHGVSLNTGTCSGGRHDVLSLDLETGQGTLRRGFERIPVSLLK